jgi:hypothetical protein
MTTIDLGDLTPNDIGREVSIVRQGASITGKLTDLQVVTDWITETKLCQNPDDAEHVPGIRTMLQMLKENTEFPKVDLTGHIAALGVVGRQAAEHQMEVERLTMELAVCVPADRHEVALAEVERRRDLFAGTWTQSARTGARPDVAALKSVVDDVVSGRWLL